MMPARVLLSFLIAVSLFAASAAGADCGAPVIPSNAVLSEPCTSTQKGDVCAVGCGSGFQLQGEGRRECNAQGQWVGETTKDTQIACVGASPV